MTENISKRKQYYIDNRDKIIARQKLYKEKNKEKIKEKRLNNPLSKEKTSEIMKKYYTNLKENHPEKYKICMEKTRERQKKYRARKKQEKIDRGEYKQTRKSPDLTLSDEDKKKYLQSIKDDPEKYKNHKEKTCNRVKKCYERKKLNEIKLSE